jgi:tetratricopeptide (TPR) repeat protein
MGGSVSRLVRLLRAVALLAILGATAAAERSLAQAESKFLTDAREQISQKRFDRAIPLLQTELKQRPGNDDARRLLARVYSWEGRHGESLSEYEVLLKKTPNDASLRADYARVLSWSGRHDDSILEFRRSLALDPNNQEARIGYARVLAWSGDLAGASVEYDHVLDKDPALGDAWLGRASVARWRGAPTASDRFLASAESNRADPEGVDGERVATRSAMATTAGGAWTASKERQYVSGPDFTLETEGPNAYARGTLGRAVGATVRMSWLMLRETPGSGQVPNYDLNSVDTRVDASFLRGYPWQATAGIEYQSFEERGDTATYRLTGADDFFGWNARVWRFTGRATPFARLARSYIAIKETLPSGALVFDPGTIDTYEAGLGYQWNGRFNTDALLSTGVYSDDNNAVLAAGGAAYKVRVGLPTITLDGRATYRDWDFASPDYFTPLNSFRGAAGVTFSGYTEQPALDYSFRYEFSGLGSSNFDDIWLNAWSGSFNVFLGDYFPVGIDAAYSIDNNNYEAWYLGFSGSVQW